MRPLALGAVVAGAGATTLAFDYATKDEVRRSISAGGPARPALGGVVELDHTENRGVAFGSFPALAKWSPLVGLPIVAGMAGVLIKTKSAPPALVALATGVALGGAAGNVLDRAGDGAVTDFLRLPFVPGLPAFNVADAATVGALATMASSPLFVRLVRR